MPQLTTYVESTDGAFFDPGLSTEESGAAISQSLVVMRDAPGTRITVGAQWGPLSGTAQVTVPRRPAAFVNVIVVNREVDTESPSLKIYCAMMDASYSTKVDSGRSQCYVKIQSTILEATAVCSADQNTGMCSVSFNVDRMLGNGSIAVKYGLNSSYAETHRVLVLAHPPVAIIESSAITAGATAIGSTMVMTLPPRALYSTEEFSVEIHGRGVETVSYAKFAIDVSNSSAAVEIIANSVTEHSAGTWTLTQAAIVNSVQIFIITKKASESCTTGATPCYVPQPGNHANQPVISIRLRVSNAATTGPMNATIRLRVYEFSVGNNPAVPPGNNAIVPVSQGGTGWVEGSVIGPGDPTGTVNAGTLGLFRNMPGIVRIVANEPTGMFTALSSRQGGHFNIAPLTGQATTLTLVTTAIYPHGADTRGVDHSSLQCIAMSSSSVDVTATCHLQFDPEHVSGAAAFTTVVRFGDVAAELRLSIHAPRLPLTVSLSAASLGPLVLAEGVPFEHGAGCAARMATTSSKITTAFVSGPIVGSEVDVSALVWSRMSSSDPGVAAVDIDTGVITAVADGAANITVAASHGYATVTVDSGAPWMLRRVVTRHFSSFAVTASSAELSVAMRTGQMTRARADGRHFLVSWSEFSADGDTENVMHSDLTHEPNVAFSSAQPGVVSIIPAVDVSALDHIEAITSGNATVTMRWAPSCSSGTVAEDTTVVQVTLPEPVGVWLSNGQSDSRMSAATLASINDAAKLSGAVAQSSQRVGFLIDYGSYLDAWSGADDPVTYIVGDTTIATVSICSSGTGICVVPVAGGSGTTVVEAFMGSTRPAAEASIATVTITVVKATGLSAAAHPYPAFTGSDAAITTLHALGDPAVTRIFQQARVTTLLSLSNGANQDVSGHLRLTYSSSNPDQAVLVGSTTSERRMVSVNVSGGAGSSSVSELTASFPGADGNPFAQLSTALNLTVARDVNPVASLSAARIVRSYSDRGSLGNPPTMHNIQGTVFFTVFTAVFEDGSGITHTNMGRGQFGPDFMGSGLFTYSTDHGALPVDSSGRVTLRNNTLTPAAITVSGQNAAAQTVTTFTSGTFGNLRAGQYEMDIASGLSSIGSGRALVIAAGASEFEVRLYFTTGSVSLGALEMELDFDSTKLQFESAVGGADFNQNFGADSSVDGGTGVAEFGGVTTNYLRGSNLHVATLTFAILDGAEGVVEFVGRVVSIADQTGSNQNAAVPTTPFTFGDVGTVQAQLPTSRRRRSLQQPYTAVHIKLQRRRRQSSCMAGVGPYPIGDATGDCTFDTTDALVTAQYLLISSNGQAAVDAFFADKHSNGVIQGSRLSDAMDVDFNTKIMVADVQHMIFVKFGSRRFVRPVTPSCSASGVNLLATVERANAQRYVSDSANRENTRVFFIVTGAIPSGGTTVLQSQFEGSGASFIAAGGRYRGMLPSALIDGNYTAAFAPVDRIFGVSVLHAVNKAPSGWLYGYFSTGDPEDFDNTIENLALDMENQLEITVEGQSAASVDVNVAYSFAPLVLVTEACAGAPSSNPSATPSSAPTTPDPMTSTPTLAPSGAPTFEPTTSTPTSAPSTETPTQVDETFTPTLAPTTIAPTTFPSSAPTEPPTGAPATSDSTMSPSAPTLEPTAFPLGATPAPMDVSSAPPSLSFGALSGAPTPATEAPNPADTSETAPSVSPSATPSSAVGGDANNVDAALDRGGKDGAESGVDLMIIVAVVVAFVLCVVIAYVFVARKRRRRRKAAITLYSGDPESITLENMGRGLSPSRRRDFPEPAKMNSHHSPTSTTRFTAAGAAEDDDGLPKAINHLVQADMISAPSHADPPAEDDDGITWADDDDDDGITWADDDDIGHHPEDDIVMMPAPRSMQFQQPREVALIGSGANSDGYIPIDVDAVVKEKRNQPMTLGQELDAAAKGLKYDDDSDDDGTYRDTVPDPVAHSQHPHLSYLPEDPKQQKYLKITGAGWEPSNVSVDDHLDNDASSDEDRQYGYADVAVTGDNGWVDYDSDGFDGDDIAAPADEYTMLARHLERVASNAEHGEDENHEDYV